MGRQVPLPSPNMGAVEPDIRGAKSIWERLAKHRNDASCASYHTKIDPPGFGLESFDPVGVWRTNYRNVDPNKKNKMLQGAAVDPSYAMPDGEGFADIEDFKPLALRGEAQIARNLVQQLLAYGTGAPVGFADRAAVNEIVKARGGLVRMLVETQEGGAPLLDRHHGAADVQPWQRLEPRC